MWVPLYTENCIKRAMHLKAFEDDDKIHPVQFDHQISEPTTGIRASLGDPVLQKLSFRNAMCAAKEFSTMKACIYGCI